MKQISNYISEAVRKTGNRQQSEFPKQLDIEAIVEFLEYNGFEKCDGSKYTLRRYSEDHQIDVFSYKDKNGKISIKFCKAGDDCEFRMNWEENRHVQTTYADSFYAWIEKYPQNPSKQVVYGTYSEFRDAVIAYYGW